jgi:MFS family permease
MTRQQRLVLVIAILASFVAFLDGSVVNVALPAIIRDLGGGLPVQQWVVDSYLLTLGALMLLAGSISDAFGRQKVLKIGLVGFGVASVICALAPTSGVLIAARALQWPRAGARYRSLDRLDGYGFFVRSSPGRLFC